MYRMRKIIKDFENECEVIFLISFEYKIIKRNYKGLQKCVCGGEREGYFFISFPYDHLFIDINCDFFFFFFFCGGQGKGIEGLFIPQPPSIN